MAAEHHEPHSQSFISKYIFSQDHKIIGIQFLFMSLTFMILGGFLAMIVRWQLGFPDKEIPLASWLPESWNPADPAHYNAVFTMHASIMIFLVIIPILAGAFGNFLIPLMIGARDMAFPKLNMLSFWVSLTGGTIVASSFFVEGGTAATGWTAYPPLSADPQYTGVGLGQTLWIVGVLILGTSSIMGAVNYITTIVNMRAPGMHFFRMPLSVWALFITAILQLMATPVLASALGMLLFDRTLGTLWRGAIHFTPAMLNALAFVSTFIVGGLSGIFMASTPVDMFIHDTYFIVAHLHYVLFGGSLFGVFAAINYWYPKMFGRMMNQAVNTVHALLSFLFFNLTFFPMHILGMAGHMRRIFDPTLYEFLKPLQPMNQFISVNAFILGATQILFAANFIYSLFAGKKAERNPWHANSLEWSTSSPAPHLNWGERIPTVYRGPYEYSSPEVTEDYLPQDRPLGVPAPPRTTTAPARA